MNIKTAKHNYLRHARIVGILLVLAAALPCAPLWASDTQRARTFMLRFRFDRSDLDPTYMNNAQQMDSLKLMLKEAECIDSIVITAASSPEGKVQYNRDLAVRRAESARAFLFQHLAPTFFPRPVPIRIEAQGENWKGLGQSLDARYHESNRDEVIRITISDMPEEEKKSALRKLDGGQTYSHIVRNYMKELRYSTGLVAHTRQPQPLNLMPADAPQPIWPALPPLAPLAVTHFYGDRPKQLRTIAAVKTNLLYDVVTAVNWAVEVPIGKRFSVQIQQVTPWWLSDDNRRCLQILTLGAEGRWWFLPRASKRSGRDYMLGHFVGIYAFSGKGDVQWDNTGRYQADGWSAGVSYGYAMPIGKYFNLEFSVAGGFTDIQTHHYNPSPDWQLLFHDKYGQLPRFLPTKAEVSLVFPIRVRVNNNKGVIK